MIQKSIVLCSSPGEYQHFNPHFSHGYKDVNVSEDAKPNTVHTASKEWLNLPASTTNVHIDNNVNEAANDHPSPRVAKYVCQSVPYRVWVSGDVARGRDAMPTLMAEAPQAIGYRRRLEKEIACQEQSTSNDRQRCMTFECFEALERLGLNLQR